MKGTAGPQEILDATDARIALGGLRQRMGDAERAESEFTEALHMARKVLTTAYEVQGGHRDAFFELGHAMQIYADAALSLARVWGGESELKGSLALARESLRLRPLSFQARIQVGVASGANSARAILSARSTLPVELFSESKRQFDELTQFDPNNLLLQREHAALQVLRSEGVATCAATPACRATLSRGAFEEAEISMFSSIGNFRVLAANDSENRSLQADVAWGLETQVRLLSAVGSPAKALPMLDEAIAIRRKSIVDAQDIENRLNVPYLFHLKVRLLEQSGKPLEALAALDESLAEVDRLPAKLSAVMEARFNTFDAKIKLLKKLGRTDEANQLLEQSNRLRERIGNPWDKKRDLAKKVNDEGTELHIEATKLGGARAAGGFHKALEKYKLAIAEYPFEYTYWRSQSYAYQWIANIEMDLENGAAASDASSERANRETAGTSRADEREAALRGALTAAWMARVLSDGENAATSWKALYEVRRSLAQFLRDHNRAAEVLPLVAQGVLDAEEYARQQPDSTDALLLLADANVGLGMLRSESENDGWEEALRKGLAYGDQLAKKEPAKAERRRWVCDFRRELGNGLREAHRDEAAVEEHKLAVQAGREALRLAKAGKEHDDAQSCLDALATLGYK